MHGSGPQALWWALHAHPWPLERSVKKGRHRRCEEARKLKQSGPDFLVSEPAGAQDDDAVDEDDEYAALARKYGAFDDDDKSAAATDDDL